MNDGLTVEALDMEQKLNSEQVRYGSFVGPVIGRDANGVTYARLACGHVLTWHRDTSARPVASQPEHSLRLVA